MKKATGFYPRVRVDGAGSGVVSQSGGVVLVETARAVGLDVALSAGLARWRKPLSVHDPAKVVLDVALALALGGTAWPMWGCCAPSGRCSGRWPRPGRVADDRRPGRGRPAVLAAIDAARAAARARAWKLAGRSAPDACRFDVLHGISHWISEEAPERLSAPLIEHCPEFPSHERCAGGGRVLREFLRATTQWR